MGVPECQDSLDTVIFQESCVTRADAQIRQNQGFSNAIFQHHFQEQLGGWSSRSGSTRGWWQRCEGWR